jgi:hypothetical protein
VNFVVQEQPIRAVLTIGAEGTSGRASAPKVSKEPGVPRVGNASGRGWKRHGRDVPKGTTRPERGPRLLRQRRCGALRHVDAANV